MRIATKYLLWLMALMFAMLPVFFSIVILPHDLNRLFSWSNYEAKELILLCITIEVVALMDVLEVMTAPRRPKSKLFRSAHVIAQLLLFCVLPKLVIFSYWFAMLQSKAPVQADSEIIGLFLWSALVCAFGSRTVFIVAEQA